MTQKRPFYTLEDFRRGLHPLLPQHLEELKKELLANVRADWKKRRILNLTAERIRTLPPHWCFVRIMYRTDGGTYGGVGYANGQDYNSEIREVITAFVGKK